MRRKERGGGEDIHYCSRITTTMISKVKILFIAARLERVRREINHIRWIRKKNFFFFFQRPSLDEVEKRRELEYLTKVSGCDKNFALLIGRLIKSRKVYSTYLLISKMHNQTVLFIIPPLIICPLSFSLATICQNIPLKKKKSFSV